MAWPLDSLRRALRAFYAESAGEFQTRFKRLVPFGDMVIDRWEKAKTLGFGKGSSIYDSALVMGDVRVGENTWIGPQTVLDGSGAPLVIGDWCSISCGVQMYTHDSVKWAVTGGKAAYEHAPVSVGSCVYIGPNSVIAKGVTIGNHVVVGAQSLVKQSLPDYSVAWGRPAKIAGRIRMNDAGDGYVVLYQAVCRPDLRSPRCGGV
jgi:acetyltransferase-like isoleucine patch superfamily enzyme